MADNAMPRRWTPEVKRAVRAALSSLPPKKPPQPELVRELVKSNYLAEAWSECRYPQAYRPSFYAGACVALDRIKDGRRYGQLDETIEALDQEFEDFIESTDARGER